MRADCPEELSPIPIACMAMTKRPSSIVVLDGRFGVTRTIDVPRALSSRQATEVAAGLIGLETPFKASECYWGCAVDRFDQRSRCLHLAVAPKALVDTAVQEARHRGRRLASIALRRRAEVGEPAAGSQSRPGAPGPAPRRVGLGGISLRSVK